MNSRLDRGLSKSVYIHNGGSILGEHIAEFNCSLFSEDLSSDIEISDLKLFYLVYVSVDQHVYMGSRTKDIVKAYILDIIY